eukprot:UN34398
MKLLRKQLENISLKHEYEAVYIDDYQNTLDDITNNILKKYNMKSLPENTINEMEIELQPLVEKYWKQKCKLKREKREEFYNMISTVTETVEAKIPDIITSCIENNEKENICLEKCKLCWNEFVIHYQKESENKLPLARVDKLREHFEGFFQVEWDTQANERK